MEYTAADALIGKPRTKLNLTEQESRIVEYHDDTIRLGKVGMDKKGRPITVNSIGVKIPDGEPNARKFVSIPGWNRDKNRSMNEREAYDFWQKDIRAGKWPLYNSGTELNKRSQQIHEIMNEDADRASKKIGEILGE